MSNKVVDKIHHHHKCSIKKKKDIYNSVIDPLVDQIQENIPIGFASGHDHGGWHGENDSHSHHCRSDDISVSEYPEKKILTRKEINKCLMDIEDMEPLSNIVQMEHISPTLARLSCFKKRNLGFRRAVRECICEEINVKIP